MAENSKIEWTATRLPDGRVFPGYTFNPYTGCTKVSPGCDHCYAEGWSKRSGHVKWGPHGQRRRTSDANWKLPLKWNAEAQASGIRRKVFCASLADVFDNHASILEHWRTDLWELIASTPHLDWLLLTKRPQNIRRFLPDQFHLGFAPQAWGNGWPNVWLGTTVVNRDEMLRDAPKLKAVSAAVRFWSVEPILGDLGDIPRDLLPDWVICGGESGPGARVWDGFEDAARSLRDQCRSAGVAFFMKQMAGARKASMPPIPADLMIREMPGVAHD